MDLNIARVLCVGLAVGVGVVGMEERARAQAPASAPARGEDRGAEAARLYRDGNRAFEQKRWAEAEAAYLKAWAIVKTFDVAANLGEVELKLGKPRLAAEHLAFSLRAAPPSAKAAQIDRTRHFLEEAKKAVGTLRLTPSVADAEVWIDGARVAAEDVQAEVFVDPGAHEVVARREGYEPAKETVAAAPGSSQEVKLTLRPVEAAPPPGPTVPAPGPAAPAPASKQERSIVPIVVLGAGSAVGLVVAIGATAASNGASADVYEQGSSILAEGGQCAAPVGGFVDRCAKLADAGSSVDTFANVAAVGYVASGVLAIGAVTYALWPAAAPEKGSTASARGRVQVVPFAGASGGGVTVLGAW